MTVEQQHAAYFLFQAEDCFGRRDYLAGKHWCIQGLDHYEWDIHCRLMLAIMLHLLNDHQSARKEWLQVLHQEDLPTNLRPGLLNNIAWVDLMIGGKEMLEEADRMSQEAIDCQPDCAPFKGTRGSLLIERGDVEAGLPLVRAALAFNELSQLMALNLCYIALGELKRGNVNEAIQSRKDAYNFDPECLLLEKLDRQLSPRTAP